MDLASTKTAPEMRGYVNIHCKIAGYWQREERNSNDNNGGVGDVVGIPHIYWLF